MIRSTTMPAALFLCSLVPAASIAINATAHGDCPLADARGDAVDADGQGAFLIDLASTDVRYDADTVYVDVTYFTAISPPSAGAENSVAGGIQFDVDQDAATGLPPLQNEWAPPFALIECGSEFGISITSELLNPGFMTLFSFPPVEAVGDAPVTFTSQGFSLSFPLEWLGGDDGVMDFVISTGDLLGPTDGADELGTSCPLCAADLDGDGLIGIGDLIAVITGWGTDAGDVDGDGDTDVADLVAVVSAWGTCG